MSELTAKQCIPCKIGIPPMNAKEIEELSMKLNEGWEAIEEHHLHKEWTFENFLDALAFVNQVGALAEEEGHHPDIFLTWGVVRIDIFTHKINGLSESDFILAAKIDELS